MNWGIRVSTDPRRGGGHLSRCIALAEALAKGPGGRVRFFVDPVQPEHFPLGESVFGVTFEESEASAAGAVSAALAGELDCLIVDSYDISARDLRALGAWNAIVKMDDGAGDNYGIAVINPAVEADPRYGRLPAGSCLFGPRYALLAGAYAARRTHRKDTESPRILISMGARDEANATMLALEACEGLDAEVTVALGRQADHLGEVEAFCAARSSRILVVGTASMIDLYSAHDLVIGAGGQSLYERMACGLPSLTLALADNQVDLAQATHAAGATRYLGMINSTTSDSVAQALSDILRDEKARAAMGAAARSRIDGHGAGRVAKALNDLFVVPEGKRARI